jgi:hypothetical protein
MARTADPQSNGPSSSLLAVCLAAQAALGTIWWCFLVFTPDIRRSFELVPDRHQVLDAFFVADAVIFIGGSAVSAWALWRRAPWAAAVLLFTAGGTAYATLYLVQWVAVSGTGAIGLVPMALATGLTTAIAFDAWRGQA